MPKLEPIPTPPDAESDDPTYLIQRRSVEPAPMVGGRLVWDDDVPEEVRREAELSDEALPAVEEPTPAEGSDLPDLTPAFIEHTGKGNSPVKSLDPGTAFQDRAKRNFEVVTSGERPQVTDGSQDYLIDGDLMARPIEGAKVERHAPEPQPVEGAEIPTNLPRVIYLTEVSAGDKWPEWVRRPGTRLVGNPGGDTRERRSFEVVAATDTGIIVSILDPNFERTNKLIQVPANTPLPGIWQLGDEPEVGDPLASLNPDDEFENEEAHPFSLVAVDEGGRAFIKDKVSGIIGQVSADYSQNAVPAIRADTLYDPLPPAPDAVINGKPLTEEQFDWVIAQPPLPFDSYAPLTGGGTYEYPPLAALEYGIKFQPKGYSDEFFFVQGIGGGWVLVYRPSDGTIGRVASEVRVRVVA